MPSFSDLLRGPNRAEIPASLEAPIRPRPKPLSSLTAAALRLTQKSVKERAGFAAVKSPEKWQADAWDMFDQVGEQHFLINTLANRLSQARLYVGRIDANSKDAPEPVEPGTLPAQVFEAFAQNLSATSQLLKRLAVNLSTVGDGWLVGIPPNLLDPETDSMPAERSGITPDGDSEGFSIDDLHWRMLSLDEIKQQRDGKLILNLSGLDTPRLEVSPSDVYLIRVWNPHPRHWDKADSPTRSNLPVLRELVGLTMHISAQVDSRLAGAGVFIVPQSAADAFARAAGVTGIEDGFDPLLESLMEAMITPIQDRASASAYVPLLIKSPDEVADKFAHISFSSPLDGEARNLRDEAIRRLALGQDAPPEILLGSGGMNHWGAWLVREDVVTSHLEPPLALICDALTMQYLWPVLRQQGMREDEIKQYVVWYSVDHLIARPTKAKDALDLFDRGQITSEALLDSFNFEEADAPPAGPPVDQAVETALSMVKNAPSLAQTPGLPALVEQLRQILSGESAVAVEPESDSETTDEGDLPSTQDADPGAPDESTTPA